MVERGFDLLWSTPNGIAVYALDDELLHKMKASGCYSLFFAVESADPDVLKNIMHKPVNVAKIPPLVKTARSLGIEVHGLFVIGLPGETREQIQRTIDFAENTGFDYVTFSIATPYPGTRMFDICKNNGYFVEQLDYTKLKFGRGNIRTSEFDPEYLEEIRRTAWERINRKIQESKERRE
jgi:anaerobic magnesium-protoporphyrin IX monomethyl ester cyclase